MAVGVVAGSLVMVWVGELDGGDDAYVLDGVDQLVTIDRSGGTRVTEDIGVTFVEERRGIIRQCDSAGRDTVAQARSFREFVRTVEGEQLELAAGQPGIDHHHPAVSLLPYAIVLGLADSWYERFGHVMRELAVATAGGAATASVT